MTTGSENNGNSRLDRIEELLAATALGLAETRKIVDSNARAIEANSNTMVENNARTTARFAEVAAEIEALREVVLNFVDGLQVTNQRSEDRFTEIVGQVRDLQVQNSRILDRLEGLEGQSGQG
jgi:DNA-binding transcriptional MerR regulator